MKAIAVIEIGTTRTFGVLGLQSATAPCGVDILRAAETRSAGIRKGEVFDQDAASGPVKHVLGELGKHPQLKNSISDVCVVYSGGQLESKEIGGTEVLENDDELVSQKDVDAAEKNMRNNPRPAGRRVLEERVTAYVLDGERVVENPVNMVATEISVRGLRTHAGLNGADSFEFLAAYCGYSVWKMFSAAYCANIGCLSPEQRRHGALVIDLGGGTTSWSVVKNGGVVCAASMPVGGYHVTADLLRAFHTGSEESALELKHNHSAAIIDGIPASERILLPKRIGIARTVNLKSVSEVVNARMDEICRIIHAKLDEARMLGDIGSGVVLCGGGSALKSADTLASRVFTMPCSIGSPANAGFPDIAGATGAGADGFLFGPAHSPVLGALSLAAKIHMENERIDKEASFLSGLFGKFRFGRTE